MNAVRLAFVSLSFCAAGFAQANEITNFPVPTHSTVSREAVRAEAIVAAHNAQRPRLDASGPAVTPMSSRTRDEVRAEATRRHEQRDTMAGEFVGGM